ncbi:hypothetical protein T265_07085 [Opisthorchis viverrini]|uniref:Uncharacterized protein n=1 Tax=Opisthorchis viverrini TaxID=6198 RepID=A0A074ZI42_OPIVI|nr:hypothetical protein T265_07085 [Opisthorchis viverrini]KER25462.1 hypothetical protein T265_07085 [Opisthorchis viverrini]
MCIHEREAVQAITNLQIPSSASEPVAEQSNNAESAPQQQPLISEDQRDGEDESDNASYSVREDEDVESTERLEGKPNKDDAHEADEDRDPTEMPFEPPDEEDDQT